MEFSVSNEKVINHRFIGATIPDTVIFNIVEDMLPETITRYLASDYAKKYGEEDLNKIKVDKKRIEELAEEKLAERIVELEIAGAFEVVNRLNKERADRVKLLQNEIDMRQIDESFSEQSLRKWKEEK